MEYVAAGGRAPARRGGSGIRRLPLELLEMRLAPAMSIWSGAVDNLWSTDGNWDTPPVAGNDLVFPVGASFQSNTNDLDPDTSFNSLTIDSGGYLLGGNSIILNGPLAATQDSGTDTVTLPVALAGPATVNVAATGSILVLQGAVSGSSGLTKTGDGVLDLLGPNTYTGNTTISAGQVLVNTSQGGSPVNISPGALWGVRERLTPSRRTPAP